MVSDIEKDISGNSEYKYIALALKKRAEELVGMTTSEVTLSDATEFLQVLHYFLSHEEQIAIPVHILWSADRFIYDDLRKDQEPLLVPYSDIDQNLEKEKVRGDIKGMQIAIIEKFPLLQQVVSAQTESFPRIDESRFYSTVGHLSNDASFIDVIAKFAHDNWRSAKLAYDPATNDTRVYKSFHQLSAEQKRLSRQNFRNDVLGVALATSVRSNDIIHY